MLIGATITAGVLWFIALHSYRRGWLNIMSPVWPLLLWCGVTLVWWPATVQFRGMWDLAAEYLGHRPTGIELSAGFAVANAGIIAWYLGFASRWGVRRARGIQIPEIRIGWPLAVCLGSLFLALGVYSLVRYRPLPFVAEEFRIGVPMRTFTERPAYEVLLWQITPAIIILWAAVIRNRLPSLGLGLAFAAAILYGGWSRTTAYSILVGLCIVEKMQKRRRLLAGALVALLPAMLVLHNRISQNRSYVAEWLQAGRPPETHLGLASQQATEFGDFAVLLFVLDRVPSQVRYTYGMGTVYENLIMLIPRVVWPSKRPLLVPWNYDVVRDVTRGGAMPSVFGELYVEGGLLAVLAVLGLFGRLSRLLYEIGVTQSRNPIVVAIYPCVFSVFSFWRAGPDLLMPLLLIAPAMVIILIAWLFRSGITHGSRPTAPRTSARGPSTQQCGMAAPCARAANGRAAVPLEQSGGPATTRTTPPSSGTGDGR